MACCNVCPVNAIEIVEDKDGFIYPSINEGKCTHCGLCTKKCPALNLGHTTEISERLHTPVAYGGYIKDEEVRKQSSSGGVFSALSKYILDKGGYVCGAMFTHGGILEHVIVDNWEKLEPLRGSKYLHSNINDSYKKIEELLKQDKHVLFTGTPCQVAGLYAVLGKDYEKLITVDLLCHGVPSQKVFREYLNEITDNNEDNISNISFRNKKIGWRTAKFKCIYKDNALFEDDYYTTPYGKAFIQNLSIRKSCCDCQFNGLPREADITIGDFWGIENCDRTLDDNKGTSAILINSPKAKNILNKIKHSFSKLKAVDHKFITEVNMVNKKSYNHPYRDYFLERYSNGDYDSLSGLINECLNKNDGIGVLNYSFGVENYGSALTAYALQKKIKELGYTPVNIYLEMQRPAPDIGQLYDFTSANISHTKLYKNTDELKETNKFFRTFIVGPDCMWNQVHVLNDFYNTYFNFVKLSKVICSYAPSFCYKEPSRIIRSENDYKTRKKLIRRFDLLSVREKSGVDNCKSLFDAEAVHVLDPVFLLDVIEWQKLIKKSTKTQKTNYPVKFIFNEDLYDKDLVSKINNMENLSSLYNGEPYWKRFHKLEEFKFKGDILPADWLSGLYNSDLIITDSYHCLCFAIIFKKQFILLNEKEPAQERLISLCNLLEIDNRFAETKEDLEKLLLDQIDYNLVDKKLSEEKLKSEQFLKSILVHKKEQKHLIELLETLEDEIDDMRKKPGDPPPRKEKWEFLGIQIFKKKYKKEHLWLYLFGIPIIKKVQKIDKTYYKLFGCLRILKKSVRS